MRWAEMEKRIKPAGGTGWGQHWREVFGTLFGFLFFPTGKLSLIWYTFGGGGQYILITFPFKTF